MRSRARASLVLQKKVFSLPQTWKKLTLVEDIDRPSIPLTTVSVSSTKACKKLVLLKKTQPSSVSSCINPSGSIRVKWFTRQTIPKTSSPMLRVGELLSHRSLRRPPERSLSSATHRWPPRLGESPRVAMISDSETHARIRLPSKAQARRIFSSSSGERILWLRCDHSLARSSWGSPSWWRRGRAPWTETIQTMTALLPPTQITIWWWMGMEMDMVAMSMSTEHQQRKTKK